LTKISVLSYLKKTGEVAEWLKAPVLKTGYPQGYAGSNPVLSVFVLEKPEWATPFRVVNALTALEGTG
jgi:hypothetical protein